MVLSQHSTFPSSSNGARQTELAKLAPFITESSMLVCCSVAVLTSACIRNGGEHWAHPWRTRSSARPPARPCAGGGAGAARRSCRCTRRPARPRPGAPRATSIAEASVAEISLLGRRSWAAYSSSLLTWYACWPVRSTAVGTSARTRPLRPLPATRSLSSAAFPAPTRWAPSLIGGGGAAHGRGAGMSSLTLERDRQAPMRGGGCCWLCCGAQPGAPRWVSTKSR